METACIEPDSVVLPASVTNATKSLPGISVSKEMISLDEHKWI